ncbi:MAG: TonB-dependent receptor [Bacteroidetes bacterium]|nr:MAG: TonB-dependent receptor [Bacteroidota bacterium]TAG90123.1 MAG: TonB-dependent receptor [Bacteroidota bacterium]
MKFFYAFIFFIALIFNTIQAQNASVTGKIADNNEQTLVGANIVIKGTQKGTTTNSEGEFIFEKLEKGEYILVVSFIGFKSKEQKINIVDGNETLILNINLQDDFLGLDDVVITGTFNPQTKLESTVSITTLDQKAIEQQAARSTGDLIDAIPGFYVESGLGEGANNIYPRGLPIGTGSFRYTALREDGLNNFEVSDKTFFNADAFAKSDLTIEKVEGLRGGNSVIFSSNTPGGIINFVSKTGGTSLKGDVKYTYGTQQLYRVDFNLGGALSEDKKWRFNVGGFYRYDKGLRDFTGPANVGGQVKLNVTRFLDNTEKSYIRFYGKVLDDNINIWTATPYQGYDKPRAVSGFNSLTKSNLIPSNAGEINLPDPLNPTQFRRASVSNTGQFKYKNIGMELQYDLGEGWTLKNQLRYVVASGQISLMQLVTNPTNIQSVLAGAVAANPLLLTGGLSAYTPIIRYSQPLQTNGNVYQPAALTGETIPFSSLATSNVPQTNLLNGNGMLGAMGMFVTNTQNTNFINNLQLTKTLGKHTFNFGGYLSAYNSDEYWNFNSLLMDLQSNPRLIDVQLQRTSNPTDIYEISRGGVSSANFQYERSNSRNITFAGFVGHEWKATENLNITTGFRYEVNQSTGTLQNTGRRDGRSAGIVRAGSPMTTAIGGIGGLDSNPFTLFDNNADIPLPTFLLYDTKYDVWGANLGANYRINEDIALFFNASRGTRYATTQNFIANKDQGLLSGTPLTAQTNLFDNNGFSNPNFSPIPLRNPIEQILQGEIGTRISKEKYGLTATLFGTQITDAPFTLQSAGANGNIQLDVLLYDVRTLGLEVEAIYSPIKNLKLSGNLSLQRAVYTKYPVITITEANVNDRINPTTATRQIDVSNNFVERVPPIQVDLTADYTIKKFNFYVNWRYIGTRWGNRRNTYKLPAFSEVGAGASYRTGKFTLGIQGINIFDAVGITEGNTRTQDNIGPNAAQDNNIINTGIFILPRSANFSVLYSF